MGTPARRGTDTEVCAHPPVGCAIRRGTPETMISLLECGGKREAAKSPRRAPPRSAATCHAAPALPRISRVLRRSSPTARERGLYHANPWHRTAIAGDSWQAFPDPRRIRIAWQDDPPQGRADGIVTSPSARCSRAREAAGRSNSPASEGPERCLLGNRYCSKHWGQRSGRQQRERLAVASRDGIAGVNLKA